LEEDVNGFGINHETKSTTAEEARENKEPTKNEQSEKSDHPIQFFKEIKLSKAQQKKVNKFPYGFLHTNDLGGSTQETSKSPCSCSGTR
jgi:hypothetical protein